MILGSDINHQLAERDALRRSRSQLEARVAELEEAIAVRERQLRRLERELAAARRPQREAATSDGGSARTETAARPLTKAA